MLKTIQFKATRGFLLLAVVTGFSSLYLSNANAREVSGTLEVTATGSVAAEADLAHFVVGVNTRAETAAEAVDQNSTSVNNLRKVFDDFDLEDKQIQTMYYNLRQEYAYNQDSNEPKLIGFAADHQLRIKDLPVDQLGAILDAVVKQGGTQIDSISFSSSKEEEYISQARKNAIENATKKAREMADAADIKLDGIVHISESGGNSPQPVYRGKMMMAEASMSQDVPVQQGEISHSVSVSIQYAIED